MGLLQQAYKTYESHYADVGKVVENQEPLAPVSHLTTKAKIEITINEKGEFISATSLDKNREKIIIPVTEKSSGRTSGKDPCPHPLAEQLGYLVPYNTRKREAYLQQLQDWIDSDYANIKLAPIYRYVNGGTILTDLVKSKIIKLEENGHTKNEKDLIRWIVLGVGENSGPCWTDKTLFDDYTQYYRHYKIREAPVLCMISGEETAPVHNYPKGIIANNGNAKLISANDNSGFTYRGRFDQDWQAATVGYEVSQQAHNALHWIAANQGVVLGNKSSRAFLCWNPEGLKVPSPLKPLRRLQKTEINVVNISYQKDLYKTLIGWKEQLSDNANSTTVIASFDAATTGRLSVTYYNELLTSDFLDRLYNWDLHCQWFFTYQNIQESPSLKQIVECAYGVERSENGKVILYVKDKLLEQQVQRLMACRIECAKFPRDLEHQLVQRASSPHIYSDKKTYRKVLSTACAVIKKVYFDYGKEEIEMALNPQKQDRSYQFGRLLAVMEKIETDTFDSTDDKRTSNAMRLQSVFCKEPMKYANLLNMQMDKAYMPKLKPAQRVYYKRLLGQIIDIINNEPEKEWNKPLKDTYLIGYYLQRNELYSKKDKEEKNESSEE